MKKWPSRETLEMIDRWCGTSCSKPQPIPSQRDYVQRVTGLDVKDNFRAYWLLKQARKPSKRAMKKLSQREIDAVAKLAESEASGGWERYKFNIKYRINI